MNRVNLIVACALLLIAGGGPNEAAAQPSMAPVAAPAAEGPTASIQKPRTYHLGGAVGLFVTKGGGHFDFTAGWFMTPSFVAGLELTGFVRSSVGPEASTLGMVAGYGQWFSGDWFVRASMGRAFGELDNGDYLEEMDGVGVGAALGWEFWKLQSFSMDVRAEYFGAVFDQGASSRVALSVGASFF